MRLCIIILLFLVSCAAAPRQEKTISEVKLSNGKILKISSKMPMGDCAEVFQDSYDWADVQLKGVLKADGAISVLNEIAIDYANKQNPGKINYAHIKTPSDAISQSFAIGGMDERARVIYYSCK